MSAELLREAAALMRERAEAAEWQSHRWATGPDEMHGPSRMLVHPYDSDSVVAFTSADEAPHIASWHPTVALAVADWLDAVTDDQNADFDLINSEGYSALTVARAYLGESA